MEQPSKEIQAFLEARHEEVRDRFFRAANVDLNNLSTDEISAWLDLLPKAIVYLQSFYDLAYVYDPNPDK